MFQVHEMLEILRQEQDSENDSYTDSGRGPSEEGDGHNRHSPLDGHERQGREYDGRTEDSPQILNNILYRRFQLITDFLLLLLLLLYLYSHIVIQLCIIKMVHVLITILLTVKHLIQHK